MKITKKAIKKIIITAAGLILLLVFASFIMKLMSRTETNLVTSHEGFDGDALLSQTMGDSKISLSKNALNRVPSSKEYSEKMTSPMPPTVDEDIAQEVVERKIIKNASMSIVVDSIAKKRAEIENIVKTSGGFIASSNFSKYNSYEIKSNASLDTKYKNAHYSIRIPVDKFEGVISGFKGVALKVLNESINSRDVTSDYIDTETRIKVKREQINKYREILAKAKDTKDVLATMDYLNRAVVDMEVQERRLKSLKSQVQMSTINLNLSSKKDVQVEGIIWSPWSQVKESFNGLLYDMRGVANTVIQFIVRTLPVLLVVLLVIYIFIKLLSFIFRKLFPSFVSKSKRVFNNFLEK